jgi:hypothetical protein
MSVLKIIMCCLSFVANVTKGIGSALLNTFGMQTCGAKLACQLVSP